MFNLNVIDRDQIRIMKPGLINVFKNVVNYVVLNDFKKYSFSTESTRITWF